MSFPPSLGITSAFIIDLDFHKESPSLLPLSLSLNSPFSPRARMNGYSRIKKINNTRSKSVDFGDLSLPNHNSPRPPKIFKSPSFYTTIPENRQEEDDSGEVFGIILSRKYPISSSSSAHSTKKMSGQETSAFHTVMKKSLSIKRSSSVSEGYSRIHHQCGLIEEDDHHLADQTSSPKTDVKKKKGGKFFKACRRLFGF